MDLAASPLVLTKLHVPAPRSRHIPRQRLVDLLSSEDGAKLILVCAPAGYGKTTLLAEWAYSLLNDRSVAAWYSLDSGDDDPIPFATYLIASFIQALGPIPDLTQLAQLLRSSSEIDLPRMLPTVINAAASSGRDCTLILDDYHLITSPAIHSAIAYLLDHHPENLRIAIGSRSDPPLNLARLRAHGELLEVRAAQLRFTGDETTQFLNEVMRLELSPEGVSALEERTEGWVAGLQLAALSLSGSADKERAIQSFAGSHRYLVEYLLEEVVNRQAEEIQQFLLRTSILERLCGPLCDALLKEEGERRKDEGKAASSSFILPPLSFILDFLERSNLFLLPLDDQGVWYRYHHLFRDFLRARLRKVQAERIPGLHRAACEWLAANGFLREAAGHAFQTSDWEYAAAFVEQHSFSLILHSEISTIYEWCAPFPEDVMAAHPMLCILQGLALAYRFRRQNQTRVEERLQLAGRTMAAVEGTPLFDELNEFAAVVRTFLSMAPDPAADPQEVLALSQGMVTRYPEDDPGRFSGLLITGYAYLALHEAQAARQAFESARQMALRGGLYFGVVESTFHLARLAHSQGQLQRSMEICRHGIADVASMLAHPEQGLPAVGCLDVALGCVLLEQNRLDEAERRLLTGLDRMGWGMNPYYLLTAYTALYRLYEVRGRLEEAAAALKRLEEIWPDIAFYTDALRVRHALWIAPEDPTAAAEAAAWCERFTSALRDDLPLPGMGPIGAAEAYYQARLTWLHAQIASGQAQAALPCLERQLARAGEQGLTGRLIELSLLEAQAAQPMGDDNRTWAALGRAIEAAKPEGVVRTFDQGPAMTRLLVEAADRGIDREFITRILSAIAVPAAAAGESEALPGAGASLPSPVSLDYGEHLSERELEVLRLMAQGASNQAIAEQLVITVGTVKSHINHILGKLDAHNRTEAVARARRLGLPDI